MQSTSSKKSARKVKRMNTRMIAGVLIVLVIIIATAYMFMQPRGITPGPMTTTQPKASIQTDQQIDSAISKEMDNTLANVNQADVEQTLLS